MDGVIIIIWVLSLACTAVAGFVVGDTIHRKQERAAEAEERARLADIKKAERETEQINCETCRGGLGNCMVCTMQGYFTGWEPAIKPKWKEDDAE